MKPALSYPSATTGTRRREDTAAPSSKVVRRSSQFWRHAPIRKRVRHPVSSCLVTILRAVPDFDLPGALDQGPPGRRQLLMAPEEVAVGHRFLAASHRWAPP